MPDKIRFNLPISTASKILEQVKLQEEFRNKLLSNAVSRIFVTTNYINQFKELQSRLFAPMKAWQNQFSALSEQLAKKAKEFKKIDSKIRKSNNKWILYKDLPMTILSLYDYHNHKFIDFLDDKTHLIDYVDFLTKNRYIKPYKNILEKGLKAHIERDYISSIPLLLIVIDGSFYTYGIKKKIVKKGSIKRTNQLANFKNMSKYLESNYSMLSKEFIEFIDKKAKSKSTKRNQLWTFRNDVMHGCNPNYANEQWSIKLLLVIRLLECALK